MKRRDEYILKMQEQLDTLNTMLGDIENKTEETTTAAHQKYIEEKNKVYEQAKIIREKLNEIKSATEDTWEKMIDSTETLHHALFNSLHYFKSQLKDHPSSESSQGVRR